MREPASSAVLPDDRDKCILGENGL